MMITVLQPGLKTTIQDAGRPGHRARGIPQSGAADRLSFAIANHNVGNDWALPALEITMGGLVIKALRNIKIAISGANMTATNGDKRLTTNKAYTIKAGQIISFAYAPYGARAYLAVAGGIDGELFEGSRSTYAPAKLGGIEGRALQAGDILHSLGAATSQDGTLPTDLCPRLTRGYVLRVQKGPEFDSHLTADTQRRLFTETYTAGPQSSRMGLQLSLPARDALALGLSNQTPLTSSPLLPGTLQITSGGTAILSGIDSHCTGGYARALCVIPADQWLIGQIAPGTHVYFRRTRTKDAETALTLRNMIYGRYISGFRFD